MCICSPKVYHFNTYPKLMELSDIRFSYIFDNPFPNDSTEKKREFINAIRSNASVFRKYDYLKDSHFIVCEPKFDTLYNQKLNGVDVSNNSMMKDVKKYVSMVQGISEDLKNWCNSTTDVVEDQVAAAPVLAPIAEAVEQNNSVEETSVPQFTFNNDIVPPATQLSPGWQTSSYSVYDIVSNRLLTFDDIRRVSITLARASLTNENTVNAQVVALEKEKRDKLMREIGRYQKVNSIRAIMSTDVSQLNLEQLQTYLEQCKEQHEQKKISDTLLAVSNIGGTIYDTVFPDGIKISKTKKITTDGAVKELIGTFTDPTTSIGLAFSNILRKHNVKIGDEVVCLAAAASIMAKHIKIEDRTDVQKDDEGEVFEDTPKNDKGRYDESEMEEIDSD